MKNKLLGALASKLSGAKNAQFADYAHQREIIQQSGLFDEQYYLAMYPDVSDAEIAPLDHYMRFGAKEGRNPNAEFSTLVWSESHPDLDPVKVNPLYYQIARECGRTQEVCHTRMERVQRIETLIMEMSSVCNLSCIYCASQQGWFEQAADKFLSLTLVQKCLAEIPVCKIDFVGFGEPTTNPAWCAITDLIRKKEIPVGLFSNLSKDFSAEEFSALATLHNLSTSLDTSDPEVLAKTRKGLSLNKFLNNFRQLCECAAMLKREPFVEITSVVSNISIKGVMGLADMLAPYRSYITRIVFRGMQYTKYLSGSGEVRKGDFPFVTNTGERLCKLSEQSLSNQGVSVRILNELQTHYADRGLAIAFDDGLCFEKMKMIANLSGAPTEKRQGENEMSTGGRERKMILCFEPWFKPYIKINGDLCPCCTMVRREPLGNAFRQSLPDLVNCEQMMTLRRAMLSGNPPDICRECTARADCSSVSAFANQIVSFCSR